MEICRGIMNFQSGARYNRRVLSDEGLAFVRRAWSPARPICAFTRRLTRLLSSTQTFCFLSLGLISTKARNLFSINQFFYILSLSL